MRVLSHFDAFPKVENSYKVEQAPNKVMSIFFTVVAVFILYLETSTWMGAHPRHTFEVYKGISERFQVNLDITLQDKCDNVAIYIQDVSDDRLLVNELVAAQRVQPFFDSDIEWCRVAGIFDTNRVRGRISISAPGGSPSAYMAQRKFNASHYIQELSFGDYYPSQINPLDNTEKIFTEPTATVYFLSIVPTTYEALGAQLETNQYTVTEASKLTTEVGLIPGVYFDYDFDPIAVRVKDSRISFLDWLSRVANIGGGVVFATKAFNNFFGHKRGTSSDRNRSGLLDQPEKSL